MERTFPHSLSTACAATLGTTTIADTTSNNTQNTNTISTFYNIFTPELSYLIEDRKRRLLYEFINLFLYKSGEGAQRKEVKSAQAVPLNCVYEISITMCVYAEGVVNTF